MKNRRLLHGIFVLGFTSAATLTAASGATDQEIRAAAVPVVKLKANGKEVASGHRAALIVNGTPFDFKGVPLTEYDGQLLVPLRPVSAALGAQISFDAKTKAVRVAKDNHWISVRFGGASSKSLFPLSSLCSGLGIRLSTISRGGLTLLYADATNAGPVGQPLAPKPLLDTAPQTPTTSPKDDGDGGDMAAHIQHNLDRINFYRAKAGVPALRLDDQLTRFAKAGSEQLMKDHEPHSHFVHGNIWESGFASNAAENQGDPNGWIPGPIDKVIDDILQSMMDEGAGGGHHDTMISPKFRRLGVGLVEDDDGKLYLTNDFSF